MEGERSDIGDEHLYKEGVLDGPSESYHENGQLRTKFNFKDGKQHGPTESYHENGQLFYRQTHKDVNATARLSPTTRTVS